MKNPSELLFENDDFSDTDDAATEAMSSRKVLMTLRLLTFCEKLGEGNKSNENNTNDLVKEY